MVRFFSVSRWASLFSQPSPTASGCGELTAVKANGLVRAVRLAPVKGGDRGWEAEYQRRMGDLTGRSFWEV
jgi:hypothetical protein